MERVTISGKTVGVTSPEGKRHKIPIPEFVRLLHPPRMDIGEVILPDGVKAVLGRGPVTVWVHQTPPSVHSLRWISPDSPIQYGRGVKYRNVPLALPYVIVLAVFQRSADGTVMLSRRNECFFRNAPLTCLQDPLFYPALLNCSKYAVEPETKSLSWLCTETLDMLTLARIREVNPRMRACLAGLMTCLLEAGFNYSSEHHPGEGSSWFTESIKARIDPRIGSVERWQEESAKDPLFVLDVPWLPTGYSVGQVVDRIFKLWGGQEPAFESAEDIARIVYNANEEESAFELEDIL